MFGKTQRGVSERPNKPKNHLFQSGWECLSRFLRFYVLVSCSCYGKPWQPVPAKNQVTSDHYQEEYQQRLSFLRFVATTTSYSNP